MKFRANWRIEQDKWLPILKSWVSLTAEQRADVGPGVKLIGRWHDTGGSHRRGHLRSERCNSAEPVLGPLESVHGYRCRSGARR